MSSSHNNSNIYVRIDVFDFVKIAQCWGQIILTNLKVIKLKFIVYKLLSVLYIFFIFMYLTKELSRLSCLWLVITFPQEMVRSPCLGMVIPLLYKLTRLLCLGIVVILPYFYLYCINYLFSLEWHPFKIPLVPYLFKTRILNQF